MSTGIIPSSSFHESNILAKTTHATNVATASGSKNEAGDVSNRLGNAVGGPAKAGGGRFDSAWPPVISKIAGRKNRAKKFRAVNYLAQEIILGYRNQPPL